MNKIGMWDVPYVFPYVAIAARFKEDSGDGDDDKFDFIDDIVGKWLPGAVIDKYYESDKMDFTYSIEHEGKALIAFLGTEGKLFEGGWKSNFSPQIERKRFKEAGGHVDWINAGERAAKRFKGIIKKYRENILLVSHSRGGPRCMAAARKWLRDFNVIPQRIVPYCTPPLFTPSTADKYDKSGLGSVTVRPTMSNDPVESMGIPILRHVGVELKLPNLDTKAETQHGLIGKLVYGHAYSSIFECFIDYCEKYGLKTEAQWLRDTQWVAKV